MFKKIEEIVKRGVNENAYPGAHFCYIENNEVKCSYYGYKSKEPSIKELDGTEVYDIASLSKIISTTTIILKMIEKEIINFDTTVKSILPEYFSFETTIEDLLKHTSGLNPIIHNAMKINDKKELIKQIFEERFVYKPRTKIVYSDTGYMLLGFIIEKIYKKELKQVAEELIFKPLEMFDTSYNPNVYKAAVTEFRDDLNHKGFVKGFVHDERSFLLDGNSGHAGVFSTAKDISKYIVSILNDENVFKTETKDKIFLNSFESLDLNDNQVIRSYGFQKFIFYPNSKSYLITHTGFTGCNLWIDIKNKRGFVLLSNAIHPKRENNNVFKYRKQISDLFYLD